MLLLSGCDTLTTIFGSPEEEAQAQKERSAEEIYNGALDYLESGWNETAAKEFDEVERQHPYSRWATKAQLMSAYAFYLEEKYDEGIIALDRFIELHPGHPDIAYAYYLKALSYYEQISDVGRDQKMTTLALASVRDVIKRFPNTTYARDARLKLDLTRDHLAGKDMSIGRYYQRQRRQSRGDQPLSRGYRDVSDNHPCTRSTASADRGISRLGHHRRGTDVGRRPGP